MVVPVVVVAGSLCVPFRMLPTFLLPVGFFWEGTPLSDTVINRMAKSLRHNVEGGKRTASATTDM